MKKTRTGRRSRGGPWIGTWKKRGAGDTATIFKMWVKGDGVRYTLDITSAAGESTHMTAFGRVNGAPYPGKDHPAAAHIVSTRIDDPTCQLVDVTEGQEKIRYAVTFSANGKICTSTAKRRNAKGEEGTTVGVWDRVE